MKNERKNNEFICNSLFLQKKMDEYNLCKTNMTTRKDIQNILLNI